MITRLVTALCEEADVANERRLLVLAGERSAGLDASIDAIEAAGIDPGDAAFVGPAADIELEHVPMDRTESILGHTVDALVVDAHERLDPNALGQTVGAVDGGGLLMLLTPPLDEWPDRRDAFDQTLAVPPFDVADVTGHFRSRVVMTLRAHPGVAIVDVDAGQVVRDGLTDPRPRADGSPVMLPSEHAFPTTAYEACLTADQVDALGALEALGEPGRAVVLESDRGRGKSSVAGLAAASLALHGEDVVVTAPAARNARAGLDRAAALLEALDAIDGAPSDPPTRIETRGGGCVRFVQPGSVIAADPDVLIVDEAAALPVARLAAYLDVGRVGFATTVHGYEGAGRGFSIRFRDALEESDLGVTSVTLAEPIRYAAGDPVEVWSFRALLLDAAPAPDQVVEPATPECITYRALDAGELVDDEPLLREVFGLLVLAHYRTEPADLARLLDAPNIAVRALLHDGHVTSVALLAREGGLPATLRRDMYDGGRVRGNMLPDVLTSQLRDEAAGEPVGQRVMRIATHAAVRSRGLGSHLLDRIRDEFTDDVDWLGTGYGATPALLDFWARNDYTTVHLSTTRNAASGEHSALMLRPTSETGRELHDRHAARFVARIEASLTDALADVEPDVVRGALRSTDARVPLDLSDWAWRLVASAAYGPGLADVHPGPFRRLAVRHLVDPADPGALDPDQERLLVMKPLQGRDWGTVAETLGYPSRRTCMRALGDAYRPLVDAFGTDAALEERDRYR